MVRVLAFAGAIVCLLGLGACKKSEGSGPVPRTELAGRLAVVACSSASQCCQSSGHPFDRDGCQREYAAELSENIDDIDASRVDYDADAAGDCLDAIADSIVCGDLEEATSPACDRVFLGKVPAGQACENSNECLEQNGQRMTCSSDGNGGGSVCTPILPAPHGKLNEACGITCYEGSSCLIYTTPSSTSVRTGCYRDEGLFCDAGSCKALVELGSACSAGDVCKSGSFCDFQTGQCAVTKPDGATCSSSLECQSERCTSDDGQGSTIGEPSVSHCKARGTVDADWCSEDFDDDSPTP